MDDVADKGEENKPADKNKINWKEFIIKKSWILLILIPLIVTLMVRLEPMKLVPLEKSAENNVLNYYRSMIRAEIDKQLPNMPNDQKEALTEQKFKEFMQKEGKEQLQAAIKQNADSLKSRLQYESGKKTYVYLGDIDSYYWLRQSRNIIEKGTQCDVVKDNACYDAYTVAPNILEKPIYYYPIAIVAVYKFLKIFNHDISLMQASFLTPLVFSLLFTIPLFILLRKIRGNIVAVIGTVLVNVNTSVLTRSLGSDSDITNVFFQVIFLWLAVECFYADSLRNKSIWASIAGVLISIYSLFWIGWWYLADLFIFALIIKGVYVALQKWRINKRLELKDCKEPLKGIAFPAISFLAIIIIFFVFIFRSPTALWDALTTQFKVLSFKAAANTNYWPNVLTTVAEFNGISISQIISSFGSFGFKNFTITFKRLTIIPITFYLMAALGMVFLIFPTIRFINKKKVAFSLFVAANIAIYSFVKSSSAEILVFLFMVPVFIGILLHLFVEEKETFHPDMVFLLTVIICLVTYFSYSGARFLFLMAVPVSIFVAIFFEGVLKLLFSFTRKLTSLPKFFTTACIIILTFLFLVKPVQTGFVAAQNYLPNVSDEWVETLEKIKQSSKPDAIINSWWDFGHWFKYFADRRVTLDGSSQNNPQLHWLGKLLLTSDENMSRGILRMLDCGGNNAFNAVNAKMNDAPHSIDIVNEIIVERRGKAADTLAKHNFSADEITNALSYSHCNPPENFLITSDDMISKGGVWAHFGSWNFKKSYLNAVYKTTPEEEIIKKFEEDYNIDEKTTKKWIQELNSLKNEDDINRWIAPWPSYAGWFDCSKVDDTNIECGFVEGLTLNINLNTIEADIVTPGGIKHPNVIAYTTEDGIMKTKEFNDTIGLGVTLANFGGNYRAYAMSPELAASMFTRLFFLDGSGLSSFEKFYNTQTVYGGRIIRWKVKWDAEDILIE